MVKATPFSSKATDEVVTTNKKTPISNEMFQALQAELREVKTDEDYYKILQKIDPNFDPKNPEAYKSK